MTSKNDEETANKEQNNVNQADEIDSHAKINIDKLDLSAVSRTSKVESTSGGHSLAAMIGAKMLEKYLEREDLKRQTVAKEKGHSFSPLKKGKNIEEESEYSSSDDSNRKGVKSSRSPRRLRKKLLKNVS